MSVVHIWRRGRPRHPDILTPAEWRVVAAVRDGASNAATAARLGVSVNTVRTHVSHILSKLELPDRRALLDMEVPMPSSQTDIRYRCSFCAKPDTRVEMLIAGPDRIYVCDGCVELCNRIIAEQRAKVG